MELLKRMRRLRTREEVRELVRETIVSPSDLVQPYFVRAGRGVRNPIDSMPGVHQFSVDTFLEELAEAISFGLRAAILFGIPEKKDSEGSGAWDPDGVVPEALRAARARFPDFVLIADVCLCEYTDHGHCGPLVTSPKRTGETPVSPSVDNDLACEGYARAAIAYAEAGADFVAPSGMMDGMVQAIRRALDSAGKQETGIISYSAKYASAFYGPFRDAASSGLSSGDRKSHQMDPANIREAIREVELDITEGADIVMVKPALHYLDVIAAIRARFSVPVAAYHVSGEYSMAKAAIERGWLAPAALDEAILAIKRAGSDLIITYHAKEYLRVHGNRH